MLACEAENGGNKMKQDRIRVLRLKPTHTASHPKTGKVTRQGNQFGAPASPTRRGKAARMEDNPRKRLLTKTYDRQWCGRGSRLHRWHKIRSPCRQNQFWEQIPGIVQNLAALHLHICHSHIISRDQCFHQVQKDRLLGSRMPSWWPCSLAEICCS